MAKHGHEDLDERLLHRMLFFTDAVFAIVLTVLVLELKPPESAAEATGNTLARLAPHIGAFAFSFVIIGVFWIAHLNTTRRLARFDWPTALANLVFLLPLSLVPFATGWLGADIAGRVTWTLYCWTMIACSATNMLMVVAAYRDNGRLLDGQAMRGELRYRLARSAAPGLAFVAGLVLMAADSNWLSHMCWALIGPLFWLAELALKPKASA